MDIVLSSSPPPSPTDRTREEQEAYRRSVPPDFTDLELLLLGEIRRWAEATEVKQEEKKAEEEEKVGWSSF